MNGAQIVSQLTAAGLRVRYDDGHVMVSPASKIQLCHRELIQAHRSELINELTCQTGLSATTVATHNATNASELSADRVGTRTCHRNTTATSESCYTSIAQVQSNDPLHWPRLVALCTAHEVTADEVRAMFSEPDIKDLCEESADKLPKHAATIVAAIKRATWHKENERVSAPRSYTTERVRCGRCQHFQFNPQNPSGGLGHCAVRAELAMALPARLIDCEDYQQRPRT